MIYLVEMRGFLGQGEGEEKNFFLYKNLDQSMVPDEKIFFHLRLC
jgi:hypothetical protein